MGASKDMWMEEIERVCEEFSFDKLTRDEALGNLRRLGLDADEANNLLNGATA